MLVAVMWPVHISRASEQFFLGLSAQEVSKVEHFLGTGTTGQIPMMYSVVSAGNAPLNYYFSNKAGQWQ